MPRLPQVGGDQGSWGTILNTYLLTSHAGDGTLKKSAIESAGAVTSVNGSTSASVTITPASIDAEPAGLSDTTKAAIPDTIITNGTALPDNSITTPFYLQVED